MLVICLFYFCKCENFVTPKISVIVPAYNSELWISNCLISILNQTLREIQVILVDDGSVDNTLKIMKEFGENDSRIEIIHQNNCGVSCAQNAGLKAAIGEYVSFVHSDDMLNNLSAYEIVYKKAKNDNIDIVKWNFRTESKSSDSCSKEIIFRGMDAAKLLFPGLDLVVFNRIFKRSMLTDVHAAFDLSTGNLGEDDLFNIDLIPVVDSLLCINESFYVYSPRDSGLLRNSKPTDSEKFIAALSRHYDKLKNNVECRNCIGNLEKISIESYINNYMVTFDSGSSMVEENRHKEIKKERRIRFFLLFSLFCLFFSVAVITYCWLNTRIRKDP